MSEIEEKLAQLSSGPGVYLMKDEQGEILYVGKAANLKKRVTSYFRNPANKDLKTGVLAARIATFDTVLTATEKEALILEATLVKRHQPRYNVILKDDKRFLSLRFDTRVAFPRIEVVRKVVKDGALYFGPFASAGAVRKTLRVIHRTFKLRKCKRLHPPVRTRPCLQFQMGSCLAPCCESVDTEVYKEIVHEVILFLKGRTPTLLGKLREQMQAASRSQEFEQAAALRDKIFALEKTLEKQVAVSTDFVDRDVIGMAVQEGRSVITVLFVRGGFLVGSRHFPFPETLGTEGETLGAFVRQYYDGRHFIPREILLPAPIEDAGLLEEGLAGLKGKRVRLMWPRRGEKVLLVQMAHENACSVLKELLSSEETRGDLLERLRARLHMAHLPNRVECFDISNTAGAETVASMVVFVGGKSDKASYRRYKIRSVSGPDDYAAMQEVLQRRFKEQESESGDPDLLVVDGGKGQLQIAVSVLRTLGREGRFPVVGIAKRDPAKGETADKIYRAGQANPVSFARDPDLLLFVQRVRDEAHRFAVTFHRKRRGKTLRHSLLDDIPGVGARRKEILLRHYKSLKRLRAADVEEMSALPGMNRQVAEKVAEALSAQG